MPLTNTEKSRRHADRIAAIDAEMDAAFAAVDWQRRRRAEKSLVAWVNTYCVGLMLEESPPPKGEAVLAEMQSILTAHRNYQILMGRGSGKTAYVECATLFALATGIHKFCVVISNSAASAQTILADIWRAISEADTAFANDYPEVCLPFALCNGSFRRRQQYRGTPTEISKRATQIVLARLRNDSGEEIPTSGSILTIKGITSGLRGMRKSLLRPTLVLLDDIQDSEDAANPETVKKYLDIISKDIQGLGGKERLSILATATPIMPDDLAEQIKADAKNWKTTTYPAIIRYPDNMALWEEYFRLYDRESLDGQEHGESLEYYRVNFAAMNQGAEVFNPNRYSDTDGHITALQKLLEIQHTIGDAAFQAEYQMKPQRYQFQLNISPRQVVAKVADTPLLQIPDGYRLVIASTDLNLSYGLTTAIVAFKADMTALVIWHKITPCNIPSTLNETDYYQRAYAALSQLGRELAALGIALDGWAIDASGTPFAVVTDFARNAVKICGIPCIAMVGRASHIFSEYPKSRLKEAVKRTVLCGDEREHLKRGGGIKYQYWDSDHYRELCQRAFLSESGSRGSCELYHADADEHMDYANQFCNERLLYIKTLPNGRNQYAWKSKEPHDYLDATAQAFAVAASNGLGMAQGQATQTGRHKARLAVRRKPRVRIV